MKLTQAIPGIVLKIDSKDHFEGYGQLSCVQPGNFEFVPNLGDPPRGKVPPKGKYWLRDYNTVYWEVSEAEIEGKYE